MRPFLTRRWGLEQCRAFFGLGNAAEAEIAGDAGRHRLMALWTADPSGYDAHPLTILRQEWWHAYHGHYEHPGFWGALESGNVVVDYGCGVGAVTLPWIARGEMAVLVDSSATVREYLQHKYRPWREVLVQTPEQFWAKSLDFRGVRYDALICTDVLEHLKDPLGLQRLLWTRLKSDGHALLKMEKAYPHPGHLAESVALTPQWLQWLRAETEIVEIETYAWVRKRDE